jgi:tRNA1(Val) A37 N6-methylase TrmN6
MINEARIYQAYYTKSAPIVNYMVDHLFLQDSDNILEPCGGDGVFVEAILENKKNARIDICELNQESVKILSSKFIHYPNVFVRKCDTLLDSDLNFHSHFGGIYDKIIANPPYGAWQDYEKRNILKKLYPDLYAKESYGLFLYRCIELLKENGILSFIIPDTFLSLHMHKALRRHILTKTEIVELALFSSSFFPGVNFGYANLSIITLRKNSNKTACLNNCFEIIKGFQDVSQLNSTERQALKTIHLKQGDVLNNPDHAFFISENNEMLKLINQSELKIGDIADCVTGFYSGDDKLFLKVISSELKNGKNYDLINPCEINKDYKNNPNILDGINDKRCFIPVVKGGNTKYLKPESWFMNWSREAVSHYKTNKKSRFQNPKYYFRFGIGVPMISSSSITASLIENKLFDQSIVGVFPKDESLTYYLLAFFNSPTCNKLIRTINPSANNPANYIKKIPFIMPNHSFFETVSEKTKRIVNAIKSTGGYDANPEQDIWKMFKDLYGV